MLNQTPATPAPQAANPGTSVPGQSPASTTPASVPGAQGGQPGATVTITAEELRVYQRDQARLKSFQQRAQFNKPAPAATNFEGADPDVVEVLRKTQEELSETKRTALRAQVGTGVRDILAKTEYQKLPESTRALILKNPSALSNADNVEEALLDIEDFVREESAKISVPNLSQPENKSGHEIPPVINAAAPAPTGAAEMEDTSKMTGPSRSRATLRNILKKAKGGQ